MILCMKFKILFFLFPLKPKFINLFPHIDPLFFLRRFFLETISFLLVIQPHMKTFDLTYIYHLLFSWLVYPKKRRSSFLDEKKKSGMIFQYG